VTSRADRIIELATARGPLGISQSDFTFPTSDRGPEIRDVAKAIAAHGLDLERVYALGLERVYTADQVLWVLPEFAPDELFRTGWGCIHSCGGRHTASWVEKHGTRCGNCGRDGLMRVRVVRRREPASSSSQTNDRSTA